MSDVKDLVRTALIMFGVASAVVLILLMLESMGVNVSQYMVIL